MPLPAKPKVTKDDIMAGLRRVGLREGDVVFVHSSLSSFGYVVGGADTVIDALLETVGPDGTVVMPAFTWTLFHDKEKVTFDVANTPVKNEVGTIPEVFRRRKGVIRSIHICHSVTALGPHAKDVMGDGVRSFGVGSTFHQLYKLNSWYLFLGVGFNVCTALHMVEEFMKVPYRYYRDFRNSKVILPDGRVIPCRSVEFLRRKGYYNDFEKMERIFAREGVLKTTRVGNAKIMNIRIRDIFDITKRYMEKDIGFLLTKESRELLRKEMHI
ncbi:aminoglycoside N(3)-acetyltransferase [Candidatus Bathyarchaeota archaeon]|nr:MAG: aminoglycoside N(3)-acetyltransferase [Candidatus Bathyarchaeota archaeon]